MAEEKKNWLGPYIPEGNLLREVVQQVKLAYHLMLDSRVPALAKLIPIAAVAYLFFPVDLIPDLIPVLGQMDDVAILMLGFRLFFEIAPPDVMREYLRRMVKTTPDWSAPPPEAPPTAGEIVEGEVGPAIAEPPEPPKPEQS